MIKLDESSAFDAINIIIPAFENAFYSSFWLSGALLTFVRKQKNGGSTEWSFIRGFCV